MKKSLLAIAITQAIITVAHADNTAISTTIINDEQGQKYHANMPTTYVYAGSPFSQKMGTQTLTDAQIRKLPTKNGNLTELLRDNPNVQFDKKSDLSTMGGELEPAKISFHGEKFYNNNFMIDGLSNNNNIDPANNNAISGGLPAGHNAWDFPAGGEQSLWIDSQLIGSLEVFDSNISAKYGDFTGGVVDAKIKDPNSQRVSGNISYRTTSDKLTHFHVDHRLTEDFYSANRADYQPRFSKHFYSASINQPINDRASLLFSYNRSTSEIPFYHHILDQWKDQERKNETFLIKGLYETQRGDTISATAMYAPHSSLFYRRNIQNGGYTNQGGGYRFNIDHKHKANWGKVASTIGYQKDENTISNEYDHYYPWWHKYNNVLSDIITWQTGVPTKAGNQTGLQGGYGKFATTKQTFTAKQDYDFKTFDIKNSTHRLSAGWQYRHESADYERYQDTSLGGNMRWNTNVICHGADGCIDGEQYTSTRIFYPARQTSAHLNKYAIYGEDTISMGRFETTIGVRAEYDDFLKNTNIAPRFAWTVDVFDDKKTRVFGGYNRYYAGNIFAYKLRNGISSYHQQTRQINADGTLTDWTDDGKIKERNASKYNHNIDGLKTPHSDEINVGLTQELANTLWTLKYVKRHGKNQYARSQTTNENGEHVMDNSGWTKGETLTLAIKPVSPTLYSGLEFDWSVGANLYTKNRNNTANTYDDSNHQDEEFVIFDNKLMHKADLPALNYNTPWSAFVNMDMKFPDLNFTWGHRLSYTAGYEGYKTQTKECPAFDVAICGDFTGRAVLYDATKHKNAFNYDWRMSYKKPFGQHQSLEFNLDINNIFDRKIATHAGTSATSPTEYKMGRNIWLGATYNW